MADGRVHTVVVALSSDLLGDLTAPMGPNATGSGGPRDLPTSPPAVGVRIVDFVQKLNADTVAEAMSAPPLCVEPGVSIRAVFASLREHRTGGILVCRDGCLAGIFTERDALKLMASGANLDAPIQTVMVTNPVTVKSSDTLAKAIRGMSVGGYRRLPVVDDRNRPVGMVNVADLVHYLCEHFPQAVYNLPPEPKPAMQGREGA